MQHMRDLLLLIAGAGLTFIGTRMTAAYSRRDTETVRLRQAMIAVEQATKFSDVIELSAYPSSPEDFAFRRERCSLASSRSMSGSATLQRIIPMPLFGTKRGRIRRPPVR